MAYYFASDVHLRDDHPERDTRFRDWVGRLDPSGTLVIVGDLCDFWMGAREPKRRLAAYPSLHGAGGVPAPRRLAGHHGRQPRPVALPVLRPRPGCRDRPRAVRPRHAWPEGANGPRPSPGRPAALEGRDGEPRSSFAPSASCLDRSPDRSTASSPGRTSGDCWPTRSGTCACYRAYAEACRDIADLVVIGHVHRPVDETGAGSRLIVLGGWQYRSSYLKIDEAGASFHVVPSMPRETVRLGEREMEKWKTQD